MLSKAASSTFFESLTHLCRHICIYIHIYIERERENFSSVIARHLMDSPACAAAYNPKRSEILRTGHTLVSRVLVGTQTGSYDLVRLVGGSSWCNG